MLNLTKLYLLFLACPPGRVRVTRWQEFWRQAKEYAYVGVQKKQRK